VAAHLAGGPTGPTWQVAGSHAAQSAVGVRPLLLECHGSVMTSGDVR